VELTVTFSSSEWSRLVAYGLPGRGVRLAPNGTWSLINRSSMTLRRHTETRQQWWCSRRGSRWLYLGGKTRGEVWRIQTPLNGSRGLLEGGYGVEFAGSFFVKFLGHDVCVPSI
jgi:hypothetical protein